MILLKQYPCLKLIEPRLVVWQDQGTVDKLNAILEQETERYSKEENLIVWDSFDKLMDR